MAELELDWCVILTSRFPITKDLITYQLATEFVSGETQIQG